VDLFSVIILAIVEGITEYLPVSSTGHMILVDEWLGMSGDLVSNFEIFIQLGAILAVVVLYPHRFLALIPKKGEWSLKKAFDRTAGFHGVRALALLFVGCLPAFFMGALFHKAIKSYLFNSLSVSVALVVGGIVLIIIEQKKREPSVSAVDQISLRIAALIGVAQCCALWPGVSRSGATIVGGLLCGLSRGVAAEFSFLVAVPVMCAAVAFDLLKSASSIDMNAGALFGVGFVVALIVAVLAIKTFVSLVSRVGMAPFGWYRIVLGLIVAASWIVR
jgi:undecaprenyl-diphosphatase